MILKGLYRAFRTIMVLVLVLPVAVPALLYIVLSIPSVQTSIGQRAEQELTHLLGTAVRIGSVNYSPFTRLALTDVAVADSTGNDCFHIAHLGVGISISESVWNRRPVITYAEIIDLKASLWRDSVSAPLNIDPIIQRLKKKEDDGKETPFDLAVNMVVIRRSSLTYDILNQPRRDAGKFDPAHISVTGLRADLRAPRISNTSIRAEIKRMGATEQSGLTLSSLSATVEMNKAATRIENLTLQFPESMLQWDDIDLLGSPLVKGWNPFAGAPIRLSLLPGAYISTNDFTPLLPILDGLDLTSDITLEAYGTPDEIELRRFSAGIRDNATRVEIEGNASGLSYGRDSIMVDADFINIVADVPWILTILRSINEPKLNALTDKLDPMSRLGILNLLGHGIIAHNAADFDGSLTTSCGDIDFNRVSVSQAQPYSPLRISGGISTNGFNPSTLDPALAPLTRIEADIKADISLSQNSLINGNASVDISKVSWQGTDFDNINATTTFSGSRVEASVVSHDAKADLSILGGTDLKGEDPLTQFYAEVRRLDLSPFVKDGALKNYTLGTRIDLSVHGRNIDEIEGWATIQGLDLFSLTSDTDRRLILTKPITLSSTVGDSLRSLTLTSAPIDMTLKGAFTYSALANDIKGLVAKAFPSLLQGVDPTTSLSSDVDLNLTIMPDSALQSFFKLPIEPLSPVTITANTSSSTDIANLSIVAPYLKQKDKAIENSNLWLTMDGLTESCSFALSTQYPTKNGNMKLRVASNGEEDSLRTAIHWTIDREAKFGGDVSFVTSFGRSDDDKLLTNIMVNQGGLVFNDSVWVVTPATVAIAPGNITVNNLGATRSGQTLSINGTASTDSIDRLEVMLDHIDLDYIFETLAISDAVNFGGIASGTIYGISLLSPEPVLYTPSLWVEGLAYNNTVFGNGDIHSWWNNETKTITIGVEITGPHDNVSHINGTINPLTESLDFNFRADDAPAGFMLPFMSAFTSSVSGYVSGDARLFGTFKNLDLSGEILAKNLKLKLDFTNTTYTVTDSVHIVPGRISFKNVSIKDSKGKTAKLTGEVKHRYFHDPSFKFKITNAKNMLVYDVPEGHTDDPWFGQIYGNGSATVTGVPGKIDIEVKMKTAPKSTFTFVLSDEERSVEHDFVVVRDRDRARKDSIAALDPTPIEVRKLRENSKRQEQGAPTVYNMQFEIDVDSLATLTLVMDPKAGDKIITHGNGHLSMGYSSDGELSMRGEYTLTSGSYNFTLQDIIVKPFTIMRGSRITFLGDPYAAQLDIRAALPVKANITDLDESFLDDHELTNTTVRLNAIMIITGDMRHPDLKFDLNFPTLTADTDRKIRSIISTDEMMAQQILYLVALGRFYTPEYMGTANHGNELVSVASSTLSSRLGSMLGQLSDNWTIAPAIRSDRGDFSDVQVDVALSSQLLDNRLLFNGNFGYRDKSLNNNSFIGDFDIRYLLNRAGSIQLKAYNRYNDQNYYLKSALTTQGIGVVFRRDFDNIFSFLRPLLHRNKPATSLQSATAAPDSIKTDITLDLTPTDSIKITEQINIKKEAVSN